MISKSSPFQVSKSGLPAILVAPRQSSNTTDLKNISFDAKKLSQNFDFIGTRYFSEFKFRQRQREQHCGRQVGVQLHDGFKPQEVVSPLRFPDCVPSVRAFVRQRLRPYAFL